MLTANQLRQVAARSGARDIGNVEIDVLLTYLLQLFSEKGITAHLAFKGGTMLRKMIFGPRGRLSTDLDFTCRTNISADDLMMMILETLSLPYHGISFQFEKNKDWYLIEDGCSAIPVCMHADNQKGVKIKLQVSTRESPILPIVLLPQIKQDYFQHLGFTPADIPCLAFEEVVAEKIRAACQRSKIRDIHDLSEITARPLNHNLIRSLAVLKLWNSGGPGLNYERLRARSKEGVDYDLADLTNLLRKDQKPDLNETIRRAIDGLTFLSHLTPLEKTIAADTAKQHREEANALITSITLNP